MAEKARPMTLKCPQNGFRASRRALASFLVAISLAGCVGAGGLSTAPSGAVAELETDKAAAQVNIASLTDVVKRNPSDPGAFNTRGAAYARIGQYKEAIADFGEAITLRPTYSPAYTNRALAFRQMGRDDDALADFNRAIETNSVYGPAYLGRGNLLRARGEFDLAIADLTQAIRLNPESAQGYHSRGLIYQRQGLYIKAIMISTPQSTAIRLLRRPIWRGAKALYSLGNLTALSRI